MKSQTMFLARNRGILFGIAQKESKNLGHTPLAWERVVKPDNRATNRSSKRGSSPSGAVVARPDWLYKPAGKLLVSSTRSPGSLRSDQKIAVELATSQLVIKSGCRLLCGDLGPLRKLPSQQLYKRTIYLSRGPRNEEMLYVAGKGNPA